MKQYDAFIWWRNAPDKNVNILVQWYVSKHSALCFHTCRSPVKHKIFNMLSLNKNKIWQRYNLIHLISRENNFFPNTPYCSHLSWLSQPCKSYILLSQPLSSSVSKENFIVITRKKNTNNNQILWQNCLHGRYKYFMFMNILI